MVLGNRNLFYFNIFLTFGHDKKFPVMGRKFIKILLYFEYYFFLLKK